MRYGNKATSSPSTFFPCSENGSRSKDNPLFSPTRGAHFGPEVRRRILLGSYTLSSTAIDNYFIRAQKVRRLVQNDFNRVFALPHPLLPHSDRTTPSFTSHSKDAGVDVIITPTSLRPAPLLTDLETEKEGDPVSHFYEDLYTVPASLAGLPAVSVPVRVSSHEEKVGLQVMGQFGDDDLVLRVGAEVEELGKEL